MKTRRSPKAQQRLYNQIGRELKRAAAASTKPATKRGAKAPAPLNAAGCRCEDDCDRQDPTSIIRCPTGVRYQEPPRVTHVNGNGTQMLLTVREPMKKCVKFSSSQEWATGQVNATVYVPKEMAEGVTSVVVTISR